VKHTAEARVSARAKWIAGPYLGVPENGLLQMGRQGEEVSL